MARRCVCSIGLCTAVDGGAGTLAVGPQTVAVGGFSEVTLLDKKSGAVRGQLPGRAVGLSTRDDGFVVVLGREVVWTAADGRVIRRSPLTVPWLGAFRVRRVWVCGSACRGAASRAESSDVWRQGLRRSAS